MKTLLYWGRAVRYIISQTRIANDNVKRKNIGSNLKLTTSTITTNVTNIPIRLLVEDIQQLRRKRKKTSKKSAKILNTGGFQFPNLPDREDRE